MITRNISLSLMAIATLTLSACGFAPVNDPTFFSGQASSEKLQDIQFLIIPQEEVAFSEGTYWLEQSLYDRLGRHADGRFTVVLVPKFTRLGYGISARDVATRFDMNVTVDYLIVDNQDEYREENEYLKEGKIKSVLTYGAPLSVYGQTAAEQNAIQNVARQAADKLIVEMAAFLSSEDAVVE